MRFAGEIRFIPFASTEFKDAMMDALQLSNGLNKVVTLEFNQFDIPVKPGDTYGAIISRYDKLRHAEYLGGDNA